MEMYRWAVLIVFVLFLGYTLYCIPRENFFESLMRALSMLWGRQVIADFYIGVFLLWTIVYIDQGSAVTAFLWLIPMILFGHLTTLLYIFLHFDSLVQLLG